jgi:hypothetical protein
VPTGGVFAALSGIQAQAFGAQSVRQLEGIIKSVVFTLPRELSERRTHSK